MVGFMCGTVSQASARQRCVLFTDLCPCCCNLLSCQTAHFRPFPTDTELVYLTHFLVTDVTSQLFRTREEWGAELLQILNCRHNLQVTRHENVFANFHSSFSNDHHVINVFTVIGPEDPRPWNEWSWLPKHIMSVFLTLSTCALAVTNFHRSFLNFMQKFMSIIKFTFVSLLPGFHYCFRLSPPGFPP